MEVEGTEEGEVGGRFVYTGCMKTVGKHLVVYVLYFGFLLWTRFFTRGAESVWSGEVGWLLVGGLMGMGMPVIDRMVYVYVVAPDEQLSVQVKTLVRRGKWLSAWSVLMDRRLEQVKLAMNNVLFMAMWVVVAFYVISSVKLPLSVGLVLGIGLDLVYDLYKDWKKRDYLVQRVFWPVKRPVGWAEAKRVVWAMVVAFVVVSLMSV